MTTAHMASPGTSEVGDAAARSKRIFDIDFERSQLAAKWREQSKSTNPLDRAEAVEIKARLDALRDEREALSREALASPPKTAAPRARDIRP